MRRATDYFQASEDPQTVDQPWWWDRAVFYLGVVETAKLLGETDYYQHAEDWSVMNNWRSGIPSNVWRHPLHADAHVAHQIYIDLYNHEADPIRIDATFDRMMDLVENTFWNDPRTDGSISEDDWWWIDAYFMAAPALAKSANLFEQEHFRDQMREMYEYMKHTRDLFSASHGLWYRDQTQLPSEGVLSPNSEPVFWSRGNGWVFAAHTRVLDELPEDHPDRDIYLQNFLDMAPAIAELQQEDGFWRSNLLDSNHFAGPEASGTALFAAGFAWGVRNDLLDEETYSPVLDAAWQALSEVALKSNGLLGYVQRPGIDPQTAGSHETHDFGVGCFLLAGVEMLKLYGGPSEIYPVVGLPENLSLDPGQWTVDQTLDSSESVIRQGSIASISWWSAEAFLGSGSTLDVELPAGQHPVRIEIESADGILHTNFKHVTVQHSAPQFSSVEASDWENANIPENAIDGVLNTRWSAEGTNQWLQLDFAEPVTIEGVEVAFYLGDQRQSHFAMDLFVVGREQPIRTQFFSSSGTNSGFESFYFEESMQLETIRWIGYGNSDNSWNSINDFRPIASEPKWDAEGNDLPDQWERHRLGQAGQLPAKTVMPNGRSLMEHYQAGSNPLSDALSSELTIQRDSRTGSVDLVLHTKAAFGPGYQNLERVYTILTSDSLAPGSWSTLQGYETLIGSNEDIVIELDSGQLEGARFFRTDIHLQSTGD